MNDFNYKKLWNVVKENYPYLIDKDYKEIVTDIGDGWDWNDEYIDVMINHINNHTCLYTLKELKNEFYDKWVEIVDENKNMIVIDDSKYENCLVELFIERIVDRCNCLLYKVNGDKYIWID